MFKRSSTGLVAYEIGEALWSILPDLGAVGDVSAAARRSNGLKVFKERLRTYYHENRIDARVPIGKLTLRKIKAKRYPKLKAKACGMNLGPRQCLPFCHGWVICLALPGRRESSWGEWRMLFFKSGNNVACAGGGLGCKIWSWQG